MKFKLTFCFLFAFCVSVLPQTVKYKTQTKSIPIEADSVWKVINTGFNETILTVSNPVKDVVWILGASGTVKVSTNGGETWVARNTPVTIPVSMVGVSSQVCFILANDGRLFRTTNAGVTWSLSLTMVDESAKFVDRSAENGIWTAGISLFDAKNYSYYSTNFGESWDSAFVSILSVPTGINNQCNISSKFLWGAGLSISRLIKSEQGPLGTFELGDAPDFISSISFFDSLNGILAGSRIFTTNNNGDTWNQVTNNNSTYFAVKCLRNTGTAFLVGQSGVYTTQNSGQSWAAEVLPSGIISANFRNIEIEQTSQDVWLAGLNGYLLKKNYKRLGYPVAPTDVKAVWNALSKKVSITWTNPIANVFGEPVTVDSTIVFMDGVRKGKVSGNGQAYSVYNPSSGMHTFSVQAYANQLGSLLASSNVVGINLTFVEIKRKNVHKSITDNNTTIDTIIGPAINFPIQKIVLSIDTLWHSFDGDLSIKLVAPNGQEIILSNNFGGSGDNFVDCIFDDSAAASVANGGAPFTGTWRPYQALSTVYGNTVSGAWKLKIFDGAGGDSGFLETWTLYFITNGSSQVPITFSRNINVRDNAGKNRDLTFGISPVASDTLDPDLGEVTLPPAPPASIFDARFVLPVIPADFSLKDFRNDSLPEVRWNLTFQPSAVGYPITLNWQTLDSLPGTFWLRDIYGGILVNVNMKTQSSFVITNSAVSNLYIQYERTSCGNVHADAGWNLISLPVLTNSPQVSVNFPEASSQAFSFSPVLGQYNFTQSMAPGKGYWLAFGSEQSYLFCGTPVTTDSIPLYKGWNIIGVYNKSVPVSGISSLPANIIGSPFFGYQSGYTAPTTLLPGAGYWVLASQNGFIKLPVTGLEKGNINLPTIEDTWAKVYVTDARGKEGVLYLANSSVNSSDYQLPPLPPAGSFDIRFDGNSLLAARDGKTHELSVSGVQYPITLRSSGSEILYSTDMHSAGMRLLPDNTSVTLTGLPFGRIYMQAVGAVADFSLSQNYPNPFNPSTVIAFTVPVKSQVLIEVYNCLGEKVSTLLNEEVGTGSHQVTWNAKSQPSGVYVVRMRAGSYSSIIKMALIK